MTYESQHVNPGDRRLAELESAIDSRINWLKKVADMTPDEMEYSRHATTHN